MSPVRIRLSTLTVNDVNAAAGQWHGLLNIDKPSGVTSREAVNRVVRLLKKTKVGHAGTLDPLATGVLVVCVGAATRLVDRVQEFPKGYRAGLRFGVRSDTDDITGTLSPGGEVTGISSPGIERILREFQGAIAQVPPKYSAVHVDGQRAYDLARSQQEFELAARTVQVDAVSLISQDRDLAEIDVTCGSGTYIRSLIRDLGDRLGCGAVMTSLRRTFVGPYQAADALPLDELTQETLAARLLPLRSALADDVRYSATAEECTALLQGKSLAVAHSLSTPAARIAVIDPTGELFAFASWDAARHTLNPRQVFVR